MIHQFFRTLLFCAALAATLPAAAQDEAAWRALRRDVQVLVCNDMGRNGYYEQRPVAELMGRVAGATGIACVVAAGDIHHFNGVASIDDPLWLTNFEHIYAHPELMLDWLPALGNHEYRGNTQAVLDYGTRSRRWTMPARYYSRPVGEKGTRVRLVVLDTAPLIDKYRNDSTTYPDARRQDADAQLAWLDSTLTAAREDWVVVLGHHPIYAETGKDTTERGDLQRRLLPVLRRHPRVAAYVCGHIHNFQHLRHAGDPTDYVVNSSASLARKVRPVAGTVFCSPEEGFLLLAADQHTLCLHMIDKAGNVIYTIKKTR